MLSFSGLIAHVSKIWAMVDIQVNQKDENDQFGTFDTISTSNEMLGFTTTIIL